ncbi:MAG: arginyltransferase [Verrucomicrobiota bacterium]|nr:arginyltransferase [Verrucomicrobiota bacterium]
MAELHLHVAGHSEPCVYLQEREATTEYRFMTGVTPEELETLLEHGWRRFGTCYFRPVCRGCRECVSLRIPVSAFQPTKSQRRAFRKCGPLRVVTGTPVADEEHLALYRAWHEMREETRAWEPASATLEEYRGSFCVPHPSARELAYYDGDTLVGVGLIDETPNAVSSAYFYYHPDYRRLSLGVASVLFELAWAKSRGRAWLYLGYRVLGCPSTSYKARFGPHELLLGRPELGEPPIWHPQSD